MSGILILESLTRGNTLKQGDKTPLKYRLFDADGDKLNIAGKSAKVRLVYPDFLTIGYEKDGLTVAQDDTVTFTIDSVIPSRIYHVEIIVDDQFIFPSRADESKFTVDKSSFGTEANIIEIVGKDILIRDVKQRVEDELQPLVASLESAEEAESKRVQAENERAQGYQEIQQIIEDGAVPADGSVTGAKIATGSVTSSKISDNAVGIDKVDFIKSTSNLLNREDVVENKAISVTGEVIDNTGYYYSHIINVLPGQTLYTTYISNIIWYDENGNFISRPDIYNISKNFSVAPNNAHYARANISRNYYDFPQFYDLMVAVSDVEIPYEPYHAPYLDGVDILHIPDGIVTEAKIAPDSVTIDKTDFIKKSTNLLNMDELIMGKVINTSGELVEHANFATSKSIDVRDIDEVTSKYVGYLSWFNDGTFISRSGINYLDATTTQKPVGATTLIASVNTAVSQFADKIMQINVGDTLLPFESYYTPYLDGITILDMPDIPDTLDIPDGSITSSKIANNAVGTDKVDFITTSTNLFNKDDVIKYKAISINGEIIDNNAYLYSHRIEVSPNQKMFVRNVNYIAWYDQSDKFISRIFGGASAFVTAPDNAHYARVSLSDVYHARNPQLSVGEIEVPYEPYYLSIDGVQIPADNIVGQINTSVIGDKSLSHSKTNFIKTSTNLLDRENLKKGGIVAGGVIDEQMNYYHSHMIEVKPNQTVFTRYITNIAWYDFDGNYISRPDIYTPEAAFSTAPDNAYYLRANISGGYYDRNLQVSLSDVEIPYEPYYLNIDGLEVSAPSLREFRGDDLYVVAGKVDEAYQTAQLEGYENVEQDWLPEKVYQKFDELVANHPSYVIKENLGRDSSGNFDVNLYRFRPEQVATLSDTKLPKMFIVAGSHGYEKTHPYILYLVMKKLCEEWRTDESLETLRWNVEFLIMPCLNPSSFAGGSRTNANGVDISRNFEWQWDILGDDANKGTHPLSEPESQYIDNVLKEHHDDTIFFTSLHNFSASDNLDATVNRPEHFIWIPATDKLQEHISQMFVSKMTRLWKKKYDWLPQDDDLHLGYVDRGTPPGLEGGQAILYGITASTYEVSRIFRLEETPVASSSQVITMGVEGLVNLLLLNLKVGTDYYNRNKKVVKE